MFVASDAVEFQKIFVPPQGGGMEINMMNRKRMAVGMAMWLITLCLLVTVGMVMVSAADVTASEAATEVVTLPESELPRVPWYAGLMGAIGLPALVVMAGILLGGIVSTVVILIVRARDCGKNRQSEKKE